MGSDAKTFEMWWPGTELNRRRQPFQGQNWQLYLWLTCIIILAVTGLALSVFGISRILDKAANGAGREYRPVDVYGLRLMRLIEDVRILQRNEKKTKCV
jgi:hypothetical protein